MQALMEEDQTVNDTAVLSQVPGVTWRVGNSDVTFPAGVPVTEVSTGGATSVRIIAMASGSTYRTAGITSWNLAFKTGVQLTIPASRTPVAHDAGGTANDSVNVYAVDGIDWTVGRTEVVFDKGQTSKRIPTNGATSVPVTATLSGGSGTSGGSGGGVGETEISGPDRWELLFNTALRSIAARATVAARATEAGITPRQSVVRWAAPFGIRGPATYDVSFRIVKVTAAGKRVPGAWKPWLGRIQATSGVFTGLPGGVYEVSVRATGADATVSA